MIDEDGILLGVTPLDVPYETNEKETIAAFVESIRRKYPVTPIHAVDQLLQQRIEIMPERVRKPEWLKISISYMH